MAAALVNKDTLIVENMIVADPAIDPALGDYLMIDISNLFCKIGWKYDPIANDFINPTPPLEEPLLSNVVE